MASSFEGRLGQQLLPDLLRDIALRKLTGLLILSRERISKSLAFVSGDPINAFSSIPSEQLDACLIKEGRTTEGLAAAVKRGQTDPTMLAVALVEKGIVSAEVMNKTAGELSNRIALSLFEWTEAEYYFEESEQLDCPRAIHVNTADLVMEGTRQASSRDAFVDLVAPSDLWVVSRQTTDEHLSDSANLNPTEGYILSMTESPTRLSEIATLSGLPDEQIRRAVCVLLALGMLTHVDKAGDPQANMAERTYDEVIAGISRKLVAFRSATHYEILGVERLSSAILINKAFRQLETMFHSHRTDYADSAEVQNQLDELFEKIKTAYETLSDPFKRREYDRQSGPAEPAPLMDHNGSRSGASGRNGTFGESSADSSRVRQTPSTLDSLIERGQASVTPRRELQMPPRRPITIPEINMRPAPGNNGSGIGDGQSNGTRPPMLPPRPAGPQTRPPAVLSPEETARLQIPANKDARALRFYKQGRARLERRELDSAAHLFREAVKLDPSQSHYHFYLAIVLTIQARARREHAHHEGCHVTCHLGGALVSNPKVRYEAEQHFLRAFEINPVSTKIALKLGQLYKEVGLLKKAELYLKQALVLDASNEDAKRELNTLHDNPEEVDIVVDELATEVR